MKRILKRITELVLILIAICNNFCYADVVDIHYKEYDSDIITFMLIPVLIIVVFILIISCLMLKASDNKQDQEGNKNYEIEKQIDRERIWIFICIALLILVIGHIPWGFSIYNIFNAAIILEVCLIIASIICRIKDKKLIAYILIAITISIVCWTIVIKNKQDQESHRTKYIQVREVDVFNSRWEIYCGDNKAAPEVRAMVSGIIANNAAESKMGSNRWITLSNDGYPEREKPKEDPIISSSTIYSIDNTKTYTIKAGYDTEGYIVCLDYIENN